MTTWTVILTGAPSDLEALAGLGMGLTGEGETFSYSSPALARFTDYVAVYRHVVTEVDVLKGVLRLRTGDQVVRGINACGVVREDGSRKDYYCVTEPMDLRTNFALLDLRASGDPPRESWAEIAAREPNVRYALQLYGGAPSPVNLYRVLEVIRKDVGGDQRIDALGWVLKGEIGRFTGTVNNSSVLGPDARHGADKPGVLPPDNPMSIREAQEFIRHLMERWLETK